MAVTITSPGSRRDWNISTREFARGVTTRLTFGSNEDTLLVWSPDGKQVAFSSNREGGVLQIFRKDASGAGQEERLTEGPNRKLVLDWSKDGKYILYLEQTGEQIWISGSLMALPLDGDRKPIPVVKTQFTQIGAAISPDGRWVAYSSATGRSSIFASQNGKMMAAAIQEGPQGIQAEPPRVLFSGDFQFTRIREFDVTPDGQRFLLILNPSTKDASERLTVVTNWQAGLKK